jgi:hypothetical protein
LKLRVTDARPADLLRFFALAFFIPSFAKLAPEIVALTPAHRARILFVLHALKDRSPCD